MIRQHFSNQIFEPFHLNFYSFDFLDHHFLNSRGAISRFDRNAIEIRLVDIQECPKADVAVCVLIIEVLKLLVNESLVSLKHQKKWEKEPLFDILNDAIKNGENSVITNLDYLQLFGLKEATNQQNVWKHLFNLVKGTVNESHLEALNTILTQGTLATRILKAIDTDFSEANIKKVYTVLSVCLQKNEVFNP